MRNPFLSITILSAMALLITTHAAENPARDAAVSGANKSVEFLLKQQNENGTFGKSVASTQPGLVGLVVKALASSPGKLRDNNPAVAKAVKHILSLQQPIGAIVDPKLGLENYNTSIAVLALSSLENPEYKPVLEKAKKFILTCQLDEETGYKPGEHTRAYGGFAYGANKRADISNSGFSLEALNALGLEKDSPAWKNAQLFLKRSQDNDETNDSAEMKGGDNTGGFVYYPSKSEFGNITNKAGKSLPKPYGNMTYMAVKSLVYAGMKQDDPVMQAAFKWIKNNYAVDHQPGAVGTQGYYYYTNVMAKALTVAGVKEIELADGKKVNWAKDLSAQLVKLQKPDGSFANDASRWMENDSVLATAYALDALNLCVEALKK
ncbi:MAG: prenyltransferase/squalene oxidase repeat-containing protein [Planctomycetota bacterium]